MKRRGSCVTLVWVVAVLLSAQSSGQTRVAPSTQATPGAPSTQATPRTATAQGTSRAQSTRGTIGAPATFQKYCFECHGGEKHRGDVSIERLIQQSAATSIGDHWDEWDKVAEMIETKEMPPEDKAEVFPSDAERAAATRWIRSSLRKYQAEHAGEPGRVTVRRLTSAEYA